MRQVQLNFHPKNSQKVMAYNFRLKIQVWFHWGSCAKTNLYRYRTNKIEPVLKKTVC